MLFARLFAKSFARVVALEVARAKIVAPADERPRGVARSRARKTLTAGQEYVYWVIFAPERSRASARPL